MPKRRKVTIKGKKVFTALKPKGKQRRRRGRSIRRVQRGKNA